MLSAVFVAFEEVEACAARAEQHDIAVFCKSRRCFHCFFSRERIFHVLLSYNAFECFVYLLVVHAQAYDSLYFFFYEVVHHAVVIALVGSAYDPHYRLALAFQRVPGSVDIGRLGIIDIKYSSDAEDRFEPVFDRLEGLQ